MEIGPALWWDKYSILQQYYFTIFFPWDTSANLFLYK
jgi:hypothetical protein